MQLRTRLSLTLVVLIIGLAIHTPALLAEDFETPANQHLTGILKDALMGEHILTIIPPQGDQLWGMPIKSGKWVSVKLKNAPKTESWITSKQLAVYVDGSQAHALSATGKEWKTVQLQAPQKMIKPLVGNNLLAISDGNRVHAFGGNSTDWKTIQLTSLLKKREPVISQNVMIVSDNNQVHAFGSDSSDWETVSFPQNEKPELEVSDNHVLAHSENVVYIFSNASGKWSGLQREEPNNPKSRLVLVPNSKKPAAAKISRTPQKASAKFEF